MRILVDPGSYHFANVGVAMLQVAVQRLKMLWPDATLMVLTDDPNGLTELCPGVRSIPSEGPQIWFADQTLLGGLHRWIPFVGGPVAECVRRIRTTYPSALMALLRLRLRRLKMEQVNEFLEAMNQSDLVVISGLGGLRTTELRVLDTLSFAISRGIPTAMFGLGIAPDQPPKVIAKARKILPHVRLIALRERRTGLRFLSHIGMPQDRIVITGDEAVSLAYDNRAAELGHSIGVNLRIQPSAGVDPAAIAPVRAALQNVARSANVELIGLPGASDVPDREVIQQLLDGWEKVDLGLNLRSPLDLIQAIGRCRLVVTGAYHIAVFALAQGVPCICLAKSAYFIDKFEGLNDQFGAGCQVMRMETAQFQAELEDGLDRLWKTAPELRPGLLSAAAAQVAKGLAAYETLRGILEQKQDQSAPPLPNEWAQSLT